MMRSTTVAALLLLAALLPSPARADDAALKADIDEARELAKAGKKLVAVEKLEEVIRKAETMPPKYEAREEIVKIGPIDPRPVDASEEALVATRIRDEKVRHFRHQAGVANGRKWWHAELALQKAVLEELGGSDDDQQKVIADVKTRLVRTSPPEQAAEFEKMKGAVKGEAILEQAAKVEQTRRWLALALYEKYYYESYEDAKRDPVAKKIAEVKEAICNDINAEQQKLVDEAVHHPAWERLGSIPSHHFIYIGDRDFLARIPGESKLLLDLAYLFITDLNDYPNPDGQGRITVFFKQLWEFSGGVGGGRTIDIGSVDVTQKSPSVSNGLFYHELSHCLFYSGMIYKGMIEGIANFGMTYAFEALGFPQEAKDAIRSNYGQFEKDFLGRELTYWRIQNYGPSCGFFLHFLMQYGKDGDRLDWAKYRRFFRLLEKGPRPAGETYDKIRHFAWCLAECFGPKVWADLEKFGFPILAGHDPELIAAEHDDIPGLMDDCRRGDADALAKLVEKYPTSHAVALARREALGSAEKEEKQDVVDRLVKELGIIKEWKTCGPFYSAAHSTLEDSFEPERDIDFSKEYKNQYATPKWFDPEVKFDGTMEFKFAYPEYCAIYGVSWIQVPKEAEAYVWIGCDDMHAIWMNGRLVEKENSEHGYLFDQDRHPMTLHAGWNRLLVKIANVGGDLGFGCRVTDRDGRAIEGITQTKEPHEEAIASPPAPLPRGVLFADDFRDKRSFGTHWVSTAGEWKIQNGRLIGVDTKRNVLWRKFLVTPGVEKDAPANQLWLKPQRYAGVKDFRIDLILAMTEAALPKFTVTLDGEGENDGLSGWTFIFLPGDGKISVRLEEYDRLVYHAPAIEVPPAKEIKVEITRLDGYITVKMNDVMIFDRISARPLKRDFIGFATFGPEPSIDQFTLTALTAAKKTK